MDKAELHQWQKLILEHRKSGKPLNQLLGTSRTKEKDKQMAIVALIATMLLNKESNEPVREARLH